MNAKQQKALAALLKHETVEAAARTCGLGETTLYRYLRDETFKAHYRRAHADVVEHAVTQLQRDCATAAKTLRAVCEDEDAPASARVTAARAILEGAIRAVELHDLKARLEEVEAALAARAHG